MGPWSHLVASARLFRREPVASLALGVALVLALASVCCGLGTVAAPWFGCELFATQIAAGTGTRPARTRSWLSAGLFLFAAVMIVASAAWLATLGLGVDMSVLADAGRTSGDDLRTVGWAVAGALLALVFIVPFLYAPIILVDRGGNIGGAVLESARLVARGGPTRHLILSLASHVVQGSPVLVAGAVTAAWAGRSDVPWAVLASMPLLCVTVPLGQGMIVSAWLDRRDEVVDPARTVGSGRPSRALSVALAAVLVAPALSIVLVVASLARPSRPQAGAATEGAVLIDREVGAGDEHLSIPGTALSVHVVDGWVSIEASDGGGAGMLPRPTEAPAERVRVVRVRDAYGVEVTAGERAWVTWVSRAGVRRDDGLRARFADRIPFWGLLALGAVLLLTPVVIVRVLVRLADVRRLAARGEAASDAAAERRRVAHRAGWISVGLLAPLSLAALAVGIWAVFV